MAQGIRAGQVVSSIPYGFDRYGRPLRIWRRRKDLSHREGLIYPLVDGPGIALLVFLPPFLAIMAFPVFDLLVHIEPANVLNPINLLILPFTIPLIVSFTLTIGYILIFVGRIASTSASGEVDHPRFPRWDRLEILEELGRWTWAGMTGVAVGGLPAMLYANSRGELNRLDLIVFAVLAILGASYAQLALIAALLHESLAAANPVTVTRAIARIGRDYLATCAWTGLLLLLDLGAWYAVLLHSPSLVVGMLGLWGCWVFTLYAAMAIFRSLGTLYYKHADRLAWFRTTRV